MKSKPKLPKQPRFTPKQFLDGANDFGNRTAQHFLSFVKEKFVNKEYDFTAVEQLLHTKEKLSKETLAEQIEAKNHIVFIKDGKVQDQITYRELFTILEYGRKDKGILPNPVIRSAFTDYNPIYRKRVRSFLLGK